MKKPIYLLLVFLMIGQFGFAQINLFTTLRSDYSWNSSSGKYVLSSQDEKVITLFEFNKGMTTFTHTTPTITSVYKINSFEKDQRTGLYEMKVTSDAGNDYSIDLDVEQKIIKIHGNSGGSKFMVTHKIYRSWVPEL
ncbi:MAG: hypothetical protein ABI208_06715 [Ginsengibacter sp.]|jgi:hypothetical protein